MLPIARMSRKWLFWHNVNVVVVRRPAIVETKTRWYGSCYILSVTKFYILIAGIMWDKIKCSFYAWHVATQSGIMYIIKLYLMTYNDSIKATGGQNQKPNLVIKPIVFSCLEWQWSAGHYSEKWLRWFSFSEWEYNLNQPTFFVRYCDTDELMW